MHGKDYKKHKSCGIRRNPEKVDEDIGDIIYKDSLKRLQENINKGEIKY